MSKRQQAMLRATRHLQAREFQQALQLLAPLCPENGPVDEATQLLASACARLGEHDRARALFNRYLEQFPANPVVWNNFGNLLKKTDPALARDHYLRALDLKHNYPDALYNLALCQYQLEDYSGALASLDRLARLAQQPREKQLRGIVHLALHQADKARDHFRAYLDLKPTDSNGQLNLAIALRRLGEREEALAVLAEAGPEAPADLRRERCALLQELGNTQQAREELQSLLAREPLAFEAHDMLDRLLFELGDRASVGQSLRAAHLLTGDNRLLARLARRMEQIDKPDEAAQVLARIPDQLHDDPELLRLQARLCQRSGSPEEAAQAFTAALQRFPHHRELLLDATRLQIRRGDLPQAEQLVQKLLQYAPNDQEAWSYRSTIWKLSADERYAWLCDYQRFVGEQQLLGEGLEQDYIAELCDYLRGLHQSRHAPMDQTLRGGTQTPGALFNQPHPLIRTLVARLQVLVGRHIEQLPDDPGHPLLGRKSSHFVFNGSWSVRLTRQGYHINHNHRLGWLSSALYLALPPMDAGEDHAGCLQLGQSNLGLGDEQDPPERIVVPSPGKLALFPSYLWHGTVPFQTEGERLTVAFDIVTGTP